MMPEGGGRALKVEERVWDYFFRAEGMLLYMVGCVEFFYQSSID